MKKVVLALSLAFVAGFVFAEEETDADFVLTSPYMGVSGGMLLPGNGNSLSRAAEVSARVGCYFWSDFAAIELEGMCAPNVATHPGNEALSGVAARVLFHLRGIDEFDKLFGCERFDPYVSIADVARFGARHVFADRSHRTALGRAVGVGALYHLTDHLALRFDAQAMLAIDSPCGMLYSVGLGLQWTFGGVGE